MKVDTYYSVKVERKTTLVIEDEVFDEWLSKRSSTPREELEGYMLEAFARDFIESEGYTFYLDTEAQGMGDFVDMNTLSRAAIRRVAVR